MVSPVNTVQIFIESIVRAFLINITHVQIMRAFLINITHVQKIINFSSLCQYLFLWTPILAGLQSNFGIWIDVVLCDVNVLVIVLEPPITPVPPQGEFSRV